MVKKMEPPEEIEIPADLHEDAVLAREHMIECVCER